MRRTSTIRLLKITFVILFLIILVTNLAVNVKYNMTGYTGSNQLPGSSIVSSLTETFKQYGKGTSAHSNTGNRTLILTKELEQVLRLNSETTNPLKRNGNRNISITFYNRPDWVQFEYLNNILRQQCNYDNCRISDDLKNLSQKDAIIFSPHEPMPDNPPVTMLDRRADQVWVIFGYESPANFMYMGYRHKSWLNTINWTMGYRMNSDVFFPYALLKPNPTPTVRDYSSIYRDKTKEAAWIVSHCEAESGRDEYVQQMQEAGFKIDIFGKCGRRPLKGTKLDSLVHSIYKFYIAFENSFCVDYVTEKFFNYFTRDVIVIVRGGANYKHLLPPGTYIDTIDFDSPKDLVKYLNKVSNSEALFLEYLRRKAEYSVFTSNSELAYCTLCDKLNRLDENRKTIDDHVTFMHKDVCWAPTDLPFHIKNHGLSLFYCIVFVAVLFVFFQRPKEQPMHYDA